MPRITVGKPSQEQISNNPREFAIYAQLFIKSGNDDVDKQALLEYASTLGDLEKAEGASEALDFAKFADIFKKTGMAVAGEGNAIGLAAVDTSGVLQTIKFKRRDLNSKDVSIKITHAGMCHSDWHTVAGEWGPPNIPVIPGHEIVGIVTEVGPEVTKFKVGDHAAVGTIVGSCLSCKYCTRGEENFCAKSIFTYNGNQFGETTQGGYSTHIVVEEHFAFFVPTHLPMAGVAPLLCAGITVYSPIRHFGLDKPGLKVAVSGIGGLGHLAVKFLVAMGVDVVVISRGRNKEEDAYKMGAKYYLPTSEPEAWKEHLGTLDGIINTVAAAIDVNQYLSLMAVDGRMVFVGAPPAPMQFSAFALLMKRLTMSGSLVGGTEQTVEMLEFCGEKNIVADVEVIDASYVNKAFPRMVAGDVRYRFVIDIQKSLLMDE